jgi:predicted MFS family arabinose efflux permease
LDVRNNPGGYLSVSQDIAGWFLKKGETVTHEKSSNENDNNEYKSEGPSLLLKYPVVVLVNEGSASASEILALVSVVAAMSLFGISYIILMPVFAGQVLGVGVKGLGILMSGTGIGALAGALVLAGLGDFKFKGRLLVWSVFLFSVSLMAFAVSNSYFLSILTLIFVGASSVIPVALVNTLLQINVPDEFRGRVMSLFMITFAGMVPFGNLISGSLAQSWGAPAALFFCGLICLVLFTLINFLFPGIRKL